MSEGESEMHKWGEDSCCTLAPAVLSQRLWDPVKTTPGCLPFKCRPANWSSWLWNSWKENYKRQHRFLFYCIFRKDRDCYFFLMKCAIKSLLCAPHPQQAKLTVPDCSCSLTSSCASYWSKPHGYSCVLEHKLHLKLSFIFANNV